MTTEEANPEVVETTSPEVAEKTNPEVSEAAGTEEVKEEVKEEEKKLIKGMRELKFKNVVVNLESKKWTWESLEVPNHIEKGLAELEYKIPSIIQSVSIRNVIANPKQNYLFQAINGSGKTGAFAVPTLMKVDPKNEDLQVVILANTRELIRQIFQVMTVMAKFAEITLKLGEQGSKADGAQILITTPGYLKNKMTARSGKIDFKALKFVVYDEADELFLQQSNKECFSLFKKHLEEIKVVPQHGFYSATFNQNVLDKVINYCDELKAFPIKKEALRLKGVKNYKMSLKPFAKIDFVAKLHTSLSTAMTMIFVNKKDWAIQLQQKLASQDVKAKVLIGGIEAKERDAIIDDFRKGNFTTLISTNVLARGIDVPEVDLVINYDVPVV